MAADFSAPSFSLGLDLDLDLGEEEGDPSILNPPIQESNQQQETLNQSGRNPPPPSFCLGLDLESASATIADEGNVNLDDDIEDFSSPEKEDPRCTEISPSLQSHATCSNSKASLLYRGILSSQSTSKLKTPMIPPANIASATTTFQASSNKDLFPRLTVSPLRKIHFLDSDSDEPSPSKGKDKIEEVDPSNQKRKGTPFQSTSRNHEKTFQPHKDPTESFWKGFRLKENTNIATPALNEFCDEYFKSTKGQKVGQSEEDAPSFCSSKVLDPEDDFEVLFQQKSISSNHEHNWDFPHPKPPAYDYFFHDDARIRTLVRERLPHFVPIGAEDCRGAPKFARDDLDYMGQFFAQDAATQVRSTSRKGSERNPRTWKGSERNPRTKLKRPTSSNCKEASQAEGNWVNPRNNVTIPKDAGKRRVSAVGGQSAHWFTGQDGRKVYVSKNGQELTGRSAYIQYKKDNGTGFGKGKKKAASKKKRN
ncbi:uncharacterized protein LOC109844735 [Asparagus officinalis]|uniref:uncharacterized protein LOC109844735 n=1 Tax=Asparagus officinalis TaxID=4686 RepID=UPI00098E83B0|nr:uncharacterized protein LOC109844735 [Asparagus officinalis]